MLGHDPAAGMSSGCWWEQAGSSTSCWPLRFTGRSEPQVAVGAKNYPKNLEGLHTWYWAGNLIGASTGTDFIRHNGCTEV